MFYIFKDVRSHTLSVVLQVFRARAGSAAAVSRAARRANRAGHRGPTAYLGETLRCDIRDRDEQSSSGTIGTLTSCGLVIVRIVDDTTQKILVPTLCHIISHSQ